MYYFLKNNCFSRFELFNYVEFYKKTTTIGILNNNITTVYCTTDNFYKSICFLLTMGGLESDNVQLGTLLIFSIHIQIINL